MNDNTGGRVLNRIRNSQGKTLEELAADATARLPEGKISASALSQWETGETKRPQRANVVAVDDALDAGGKILAAYGLMPPEGDGTKALLLDVLHQFGKLREQLAVQAAELDRQVQQGEFRQRQIDDLVRRLDLLER